MAVVGRPLDGKPGNEGRRGRQLSSEVQGCQETETPRKLMEKRHPKGDWDWRFSVA